MQNRPLQRGTVATRARLRSGGNRGIHCPRSKDSRESYLIDPLFRRENAVKYAEEEGVACVSCESGGFGVIAGYYDGYSGRTGEKPCHAGNCTVTRQKRACPKEMPRWILKGRRNRWAVNVEQGNDLKRKNVENIEVCV